ncbi:MAG: histidinol-phosphate transaminase, partial [Desulfovibrionaceae bacterium]
MPASAPQNAPERARIRAAMLDFDPYVPGLSAEEIRERYGVRRIVKLASNENPLGTSPIVQKRVAARANGCHIYPRNHSPELAAALAARFGLAPERVILGNGSDEVIDLLLRVTAEPGRDHVLSYRHNFSVYRLTAKLCGVGYREVDRDDGLALPVKALAAAADERTALVFLTSPDNPTGHTVRAAEMAELAAALPPRTLLVVDEAYVEFAEPEADHTLARRLDEFPNVAVCRTFSKAYGLAGLRLGYGLLPPVVAEYVARARIPFTVNVLAQEAGLAALEDEVFLQVTLDTVRAGRARLREGLTALGCEVLPSQANFLMFRSPAPA